MNIVGRTTHYWLKNSVIRFAHTKNCSLHFLCFLLCFLLKYIEIKEIVFYLYKTNNKEIWLSKSCSAPEIHVSLLYYGDLRSEKLLYMSTPHPLGFVLLLVSPLILSLFFISSSLPAPLSSSSSFSSSLSFPFSSTSSSYSYSSSSSSPSSSSFLFLLYRPFFVLLYSSFSPHCIIKFFLSHRYPYFSFPFYPTFTTHTFLSARQENFERVQKIIFWSFSCQCRHATKQDFWRINILPCHRV